MYPLVLFHSTLLSECPLLHRKKEVRSILQKEVQNIIKIEL